jgi:predicted ATPase/DNA-binding SARP family transcriptional activator
VVSPSELIDVLWGDDPPRTASKTIQAYISALRRLLPPATIDTSPGGYRLNVDPDDIDITGFERDLGRGARALEDRDLRQAAQFLSRVVAMWRGEPLVEVANQPMGMAEKARLEELLRGAQDLWVDARLALGEHATLIGDLEAAVAAEPLRERRWEQLMLALYQAGRQSDALRAFQRLRGVLADELGLEPGQAARDLEAAILGHDPALAPVLARTRPRFESDTPGLPTGNVTFVFSDVEDSTLLARRLGPWYPVILEEHRSVVRAAITGQGGTEVETNGDAFFFAFSDATAAVCACVEAQGGLAAHTWPAEGTIRVRMGILSGVAEPTGSGEYLSVAVHQAHRIMDAGHGGQILCSETTAGLIRHHLPDGMALVDRGAYLLRGFDEPERIFQVVHPDLESAFPPLRASPATSHNLPNVRTSFVGRVSDLGALADLLGRSKLVTVVGPGGVGKTRLAVEAASRQVGRFEGGIRLADLSTLEDPGAVATTIAGAFGVRALPHTDPLEAVCRTLAGGHALLILDNCEHVAGAARAAVEGLLDGLPEMSVLATSRQPLGVTGEQLWRVAPLRLPDPNASANEMAASEAVQLFVERARLARPDFALTGANAIPVAAICRALDGLPLALELTSARVATQPLSDLASRLSEGLGDIRNRYGDSRERHATLDATMAWSYERLQDDEASLLRSLSVFSGGFTIEAVLAVGTARSPRETLLNLVDKSLVTWDQDAGRYRLLDTIRRFAADRLQEDGDLLSARTAHAAFYCSVACGVSQDLTGPDQARTLEILSLDHDNLRRALGYLLDQVDGAEDALRMLAALRRYWFLRSDLVEWTSSIEGLLQREDPRVSPVVRGQALVAATLSAAYVDAAAARRWGEMGLAVARSAGDDVSATEVSSLLAVISYFLGAPDPGLGEQAVSMARRIGDPRLVGQALFGAAMSHMGEPLEASRLYQEAVSVTARSGDRFFHYFALANLGLLHQQLDNLPAAQSYLEQAVELGRDLGYRDPLVMSTLGRVLTDRGLLSEAYDRLDAAVHFPQNSPYQSAGAMRGAVHFAVAVSEWHIAARLFGFADVLLGRSGHGAWGDEPLYEQDRSLITSQLGDLFQSEYDFGAGLSWPKAVQMARTLERSTRQEKDGPDDPHPREVGAAGLEVRPDTPGTGELSKH